MNKKIGEIITLNGIAKSRTIYNVFIIDNKVKMIKVY